MSSSARGARHAEDCIVIFVLNRHFRCRATAITARENHAREDAFVKAALNSKPDLREQSCERLKKSGRFSFGFDRMVDFRLQIIFTGFHRQIA